MSTYIYYAQLCLLYDYVYYLMLQRRSVNGAITDTIESLIHRIRSSGDRATIERAEVVATNYQQLVIASFRDHDPDRSIALENMVIVQLCIHLTRLYEPSSLELRMSILSLFDAYIQDRAKKMRPKCSARDENLHHISLSRRNYFIVDRYLPLLSFYEKFVMEFEHLASADLPRFLRVCHDMSVKNLFAYLQFIRGLRPEIHPNATTYIPRSISMEFFPKIDQLFATFRTYVITNDGSILDEDRDLFFKILISKNFDPRMMYDIESVFRDVRGYRTKNVHDIVSTIQDIELIGKF